MPRRWCVIATFILFCWISGAAAQVRETGDISGRWETDGVPGSPWTFDLATAGSAVTGRVLQHGGQPGSLASTVFSVILSRSSAHFSKPSRAGHNACPHFVKRYSTLGGTC
jgi:hypothetical protein